MKIVIDTETGRLMAAGPEGVREYALSSAEGWQILSRLRRTVAAQQIGLSHGNWRGAPIDQSPADLFAVQDVICQVQPNVILQAAEAAAGTLLFYADVLRNLGGGKVLSVATDLAPATREILSTQEFSENVQMMADRAEAKDEIARLKSELPADPRVMVILGSAPNLRIPFEEVEGYSSLVSVGSFLVVTGDDEQSLTPPAAVKFALEHAEFRLETPEWSRREETGAHAEIFTEVRRFWLRRVK